MPAVTSITILKQLLKTLVYKWKNHVEGLTDRLRRKILRFVIWIDMLDYIKED